MTRTSLYCVVFAVFLLAGCIHTGEINGADLTHLKLGMSKDEVISILGKPQSASANEEFEIYRYFEDLSNFRLGNFRLVYHNLIFVDGKLKRFDVAGRN